MSDVPEETPGIEAKSMTTEAVLAGSALLSMGIGGGLLNPASSEKTVGALLVFAGLALSSWTALRIKDKLSISSLELKAAQRETEESRALAVQERNVLDGLAEGLDVWILLLDHAGNIQYANDKAMRAFGIKNPLGQSVLAVTLSRTLHELVVSASRGLVAESTELTLQHPVERTVSARVWPVDERREQFFLTIYDVTDLRRLERARRDFVANVSHELRTPMATIRAMAETILDEQTTSDSTNVRYLQKVITEIDRLTRISDDLLVLSAAESDQKLKEPIELASVVNAAVHQVRPKAERKGLELVSDDVQPAVVWGNSEQLTQVMLNLLDNAINYTAEGQVTVTLRTQSNVALVSVRDTGIGIPSEHLTRVFERFYRVDKARSRATGGTGLGLSIVRNIIDSHNGTVGVDSVLNSGTTFWFKIPLLEDE